MELAQYLALRGHVYTGHLEGPFNNMWRSVDVNGNPASQSMGSVSRRDVFSTRDEAAVRANEQRAEYHAKKNAPKSKSRRGRKSAADRLIGEDYTSHYDNND